MGRKDFALTSVKKDSSKKSKMLQIKVTTMDAELEFAIQPNTTGKQLFDQVVKTIGLREIWFFGLQYVDSKGFITWLKLNKKVTSQDMKKEGGGSDKPSYNFKFRAKFYPEDVSTELIQEITQKLFFLQVKESILNDDVYCPPETSVLLASYQVQAKFGPFIPEVHVAQKYLQNEKLLPERVVKQHRMNSDEWQERISTWHQEHGSMPREEAIMEYLKIAQDLEMYGVSYFEIMNKKKTELYLGVDALGLNIYEKKDMLTPKIGFPWSEIRNISFNDRKFVIKPIDRKAPDFQFYVERLRINKRILALCMGNHELYMRRRQPDPIEVQQMRAQAKEEQQKRDLERQRFESERKRLQEEEQARLLLEKEKQELLDRLRQTEEERNRFHEQTLNFQAELDEKLRAQAEMQEEIQRVEKEREELENKRREAEREAQLLQESQAAEGEEKLRLEQEMAEKLRLIAEMEERERQKEEELEKWQSEANTVQDDLKRTREEMEQLSLEQREREAARIKEEEEKREKEMELLREQIARDRDEENRQTEAQRNKELQQQLAELKHQLGDLKDTNASTVMDMIHAENVKQGRDKYKTLKQIRKGNTKHRVDQFEALWAKRPWSESLDSGEHDATTATFLIISNQAHLRHSNLIISYRLHKFFLLTCHIQEETCESKNNYIFETYLISGIVFVIKKNYLLCWNTISVCSSTLL